MRSIQRGKVHSVREGKLSDSSVHHYQVNQLRRLKEKKVASGQNLFVSLGRSPGLVYLDRARAGAIECGLFKSGDAPPL